MNNIIKLGVIGGGINSTIGYSHFCASKMDGKFKYISGYFSRNKIKNKLSHQKYNINFKHYTSLDNYLKNEYNKIDAFLVITDTHSHFKVLKKLVQFKKTIICEKPSVSDNNEHNLLKKLIIKNNILFFPTYIYLGYPVIKDIKSIIKDGKIGKVEEINLFMPQQGLTLRKIGMVKNWRKRDSKFPTIQLDLTVHLLSILKFIFPRVELKNVKSKSLIKNKLVHTNYLWMDLSNNIFCNIYASKNSIGDRNGLEIDILGNEGRLKWKHTKPEILKMFNLDGTLTVLDRADFKYLKNSSKLDYNRYTAGHPTGFIEAMSNYYLDIYDCIKKNKNEIFDLKSEGFIFDTLKLAKKNKL